MNAAGDLLDGSETRLPRKAFWLLFALVLLLRLPFLNQAVQGDDDVYLTEAAHAQVEPLHPDNTSYVFKGDVVDLRGHTHPGSNAWPSAALLALFGSVKEVPFHLAYIAFSLIAVTAMWSLARRFSPHPTWACLLFLAVPAFVVNGNSFEPDVPFAACWMAAVALFCAGRWGFAALAMAAATLFAYQSIFLTPILALYLLIYRRRDRAAWLSILTPFAAVAVWQMWARSTGAMPAVVLTGYFSHYGFQAIQHKLTNALGLAIHTCFIVFPLLVPGAILLAWRNRRDRETQFLLGWIALFYMAAVVVFFAGSARYLLPMAPAVVLLASRLSTRWLAVGFAAQMALSLGLAAENYQHWDAYRNLRVDLHGSRVWVDGEWGLRFYLEERGALPLTHAQPLRPGDFVVSSALGHAVDLNSPATVAAQTEITSAVPLRIIGLGSHSGYSDSSAGFWPFGVSTAPIDRVTTYIVGERHVTQAFLNFKAGDAHEQVLSGISPDGWMGSSASIALKSPGEALPVRVEFFLPQTDPPRHVTLSLDGREVAAKTYSAPGAYTLTSAPTHPQSETAVMEITIDHTFHAAGDARDLGGVIISAGFAK